MRPVITGGGLVWEGRGELAPILAIVLTAMTDQTWHRLKACPDCRWVFYDNTRNASKRWCLMTAGGPNGRSCGSIAKVRAYRERAGSTVQ
jgi:predicted RNA-binding Zn ribbon-like protein